MGSISRDEINVDLVVVGGGPTGLLTGYLCEQLGVNVCILAVDAKAAPLAIGRADALNARTQQYLEVVGILDELLPEGITCNTSSTFADGEFKSRQSHWWTSLKHTHRKNFLMLGQPLVEKALSSRMKSPVLYGEHVTSINEGDEDVIVGTSGGRTIRSRYVVGADGARSTIRTALGVNFTGTKPEMTWAVLDTFIDTDFPVCSEIVTFQLNQESRVAWIPRERDLARFYVLLEGEITEERAKESIRAHMAPHRVDFVWTEWFIKERIASTFVTKEGQGRVILAGDAAHVHSVNGGQGLNTGIADAFGLAWRLAYVLTNKTANKTAAQDLIKSYDSERRVVAQGVIDVAATLVRETVRTAKSYVSAIERNAGYITGMGVSYDGIGSKLIHDSSVGIWTAGHRCPDLYLMPTLDAEAKRLYSLLSYGRHLILHVGRPESRAGGEANKAISDGVARTFRVLPRPEGAEAHADVSPGVEVFWANWVRPTDNYVVIVRPDLYVGFVGNNDQEWRNYLSYLT
ncbi:FAD monooxygenase [Verticillium alfalfae VaMs.102]|uniref:FAD monooxygenase n=1 Tax=Verticillium alfalfae (strain VaMs.102 / ATCC MYA-4576 / FGSC 10136) TaxID=526221 RepID=C9SG00_VERA1|nr:FAD monooxygenase [Verticillium alfalfae VaMs.102]EEY17404.1 FAD monooxygenase [Verticillium alfalfae VaMs.102]